MATADGVDEGSDVAAPAASMVAQFAAGLVGAIPDALPEDAVLAPSSVAWRVHSDLSASVAGVRSLLVQALHPLAMAGVHQHSNWRADPLDRMAATARYVTVLTYGGRRTATRLAGQVRAMHERVRGTDPETGTVYAATDPALLLWVHVAMVESYIASMSAYGPPLTDSEWDRYCLELVEFGELIGIPRAIIPATRGDVDDYMAAQVPGLRYSAAAREAIPFLLEPPEDDEEIRETWTDVCAAAIAILPPWAGALYGWPQRDVDDAYRTSVRQVLGTLDFALEMEPGVIDARQRVLAWARAAAQ